MHLLSNHANFVNCSCFPASNESPHGLMFSTIHLVPHSCYLYTGSVVDTFPGVLTDKTVKLWKISERDKRPEGYNLKDEEGRVRDPTTITALRVRCPAFPLFSLVAGQWIPRHYSLALQCDMLWKKSLLSQNVFIACQTQENVILGFGGKIFANVLGPQCFENKQVSVYVKGLKPGLK